MRVRDELIALINSKEFEDVVPYGNSVCRIKIENIMAANQITEWYMDIRLVDWNELWDEFVVSIVWVEDKTLEHILKYPIEIKNKED